MLELLEIDSILEISLDSSTRIIKLQIVNQLLTLIDTINQVHDSYLQNLLELTEVLQLENDSIFITNEWEADEKLFYSYYIDILRGDTLLEGQLDTLQQMAQKCPNSGGMAVYFANGLLQNCALVSVSMENIDVLCFSGHKGLLGIGGIGGFCVKDIEVKPLISGGTGIDSFNPQMPEAYPEHLEAGTQNLAGIAALNAGVQYVLSHQKAIVEKEHFLLQKLYEGLTGDVEFYSSLENSTPIVALNISGKDSAYVSDLLNYKYGIVTRCGAHCAPLMHKHLKTEEQGIVRLSVSFQNTIEDVDFVVRAIQEISNDH